MSYGGFMLVLTRKSNESVIVGGEDSQHILSVTVLAVNGGKVKLGFDAANGVAVHRSEVWERIHANGGPNGSTEDLAEPCTG